MSNTRSSPLVSICVPIYNVHDYIERCVRSLLGQTYPNLEYLFVDDCSPDNSVEIMQRVLLDFPQRVPQVRVLRHGKNRGLAAARNTAVANARGEFIMHIDSDDWVDADAVELLIEKQKETEAEIVSCDILVHHQGTSIFRACRETDSRLFLLQTLRHQSDHMIIRRLYKCSLYKENDIFAEEGVNYGEDKYTLPRLVYYASKMAVLEKPLYHYNRENNTSYVNSRDKGRLQKTYYQDKRSYEILEDFFIEKNDHECLNVIERAKADCAFVTLLVSARLFDKSCYYLTLKDFCSFGEEIRQAMGWDNVFVRFVYGHYFTCSLIQNVLRVVRKIRRIMR